MLLPCLHPRFPGVLDVLQTSQTPYSNCIIPPQVVPVSVLATYHLPSPSSSRQTRRITPVSFLPPKYYKIFLTVTIQDSGHQISHPGKCENLLTQALASNFHPTPGFPTTNQNKYLRLQTGLCHTPPGTLTSHRPHLFYCPQLTTLGLRSSLCSKHSHPILCN